MRYSQSAALPALADAIASIWELDAAGTPLNEPIFPDGRIEVIVHLGNRPTVAGESAQQPGLMVVGQMTALDGRGRGTKRIAPAIGSAGNTRGTSAARIRA